jgi:hypothetical protein
MHKHCYCSSVHKTATALNVILTHLSAIMQGRTLYNIYVEGGQGVSSCSQKYWVIHESMKHFKNSQQIDYATDHGNSYANRERNSLSFFYIISQMLSLFIFGNTADIYAIVHLVSHACQHITFDHICYYCILAANEDDYVCGLFLK